MAAHGEQGGTGPAARALLVYVTVPDEETAVEIARGVVEERLAACVNVVPEIRSFYRWQGRVEDEGEWLLLMKTDSRAFEGLRRRVAELHPYEVPCITAMPVVMGHEPYLAWVSDEVAPDER